MASELACAALGTKLSQRNPRCLHTALKPDANLGAFYKEIKLGLVTAWVGRGWYQAISWVISAAHTVIWEQILSSESREG